MGYSNIYLIASIKLCGAMALLLYGMKLMSDTLQKMAGSQMRHIFSSLTSNRFTGVLTGLFVTAMVQSSTATTVMTVSFVNASLLTLAQAISVIMGANIGTTLTAWIMSAGFSFNFTDLVWPAMVVAVCFIIYMKSKANIGEFIFGLSFMFLGLGTLRQTGIDLNLGGNPDVIAFFESFDPNSFTTSLIFLLIGSVLTMLIHSSAAVMAITMILCSTGVMPIYQGVALVLGENIGTTITAYLVALTESTQARRAAVAHMVFNVFGVIWVLCIFKPFINMVCMIVGYDINITRATASEADFMRNATLLSLVLATFHTCFNLLNTTILIWFVPQIEKLVCKLVRPKHTDSDGQEIKTGPTRLKYINGGLIQTPELAIVQAQREIVVFAERVERMFNMLPELMEETDTAQFAKRFARIEKYETIADNMEIEIAYFLEQVSDAHLSEDCKAKIRSMMRQIGELESVADACFNIARNLNRKQEQSINFVPKQKENLGQLFLLNAKSIAQMKHVLRSRREEVSLEPTMEMETATNQLRNKLCQENIADVNNHLYDYTNGSLYQDLVSQAERLGDYVVNVVEARLKLDTNV